MEVTGTVGGSLTKRAALLYTVPGRECWLFPFTFSYSDWTCSFELTAVHLITGILAVHFLVTLAWVGDAASVSALELIGWAQCGWQTQKQETVFSWNITSKCHMPACRKSLFNQGTQLTVTEDFIRIVSAVVLPVAPGAMSHAAAVHTPSVALLTHTVGWEPERKWYRLKLQMSTRRMWLKLFGQRKGSTHHSRTVSHQTYPCSGPCHHKSGCSWHSLRFHTQTHQCCYM